MAEEQGSSMFQANLKRYIPAEITEEEIIEKKKSPLCENCVKEGPSEGERRLERESWFEQESWVIERVAVFLCSDCGMYACVNCLPGHQSHEGMRVGRKEQEREKEREMSESVRMEEHGSSERIKYKGKGLGKKTKRMRLEEGNEKEEEKRESDNIEEETERKLCLLLDGLIRESEIERIEKFERSHVSLYDRVYVQHELDLKDCWISGLCGLENQRWVACDCYNSCIKIFTLGSNILQRYIRFEGSGPYNVTEILVNQNSTESNLASGSSSGVSVTNRAEQDKQCLIAVTLPWKRQILFIELSKKPAFIHKVIHTEGLCWSIQFYDNRIFTACWEGLDSPWSVYMYSTDGDTLNKFDIATYGYLIPYLAVGSGRVYLTDWDKNKVQCRNVEGQVLSEITTEGSGPKGISIDPDNNVYVCALRHDKVYKLDADLTRHESVLDQTAGYLEGPGVLCYYRDKLLISHLGPPSLRNFVTVVRLL